MSYSHSFGRRLAVVAVACGCIAVAAAPAEAAGAGRLGRRTLHFGMRGRDVMWLQRDLTKVGFPTRVTHDFNRVTRTEVRRFQSTYGLAADGVVGPLTRREIRLALDHTAVPADNGAQPGQGQMQPLPAGDTGGAGLVPPPSAAPVTNATIDIQGLAMAPLDAPPVIQRVIAAANRIAFKPYVYGGGHGNWNSSGYDCSGSVSYALHAGGLLATSLDSSQFESYGAPGPGRWITLYTDAGHVYMTVAGLTFDTVNQQFGSHKNDRWSVAPVPWEKTQNYTVVHPVGW